MAIDSDNLKKEMGKIIEGTYRVKGMSCNSCARNVETTLSKLKGVVFANVNFADASVYIKHDSRVIQSGDTQFK